jgi:hypothetical protein
MLREFGRGRRLRARGPKPFRGNDGHVTTQRILFVVVAPD